MVTHNELDRYIPDTVPWLQTICDAVHIFDDASTDGTFEYLASLGVTVAQRAPFETSFAEDESAFRGRAWRVMETMTAPTENDWVLCIDADEFLLAGEADQTRDVLTSCIEMADNLNSGSVTFPVREVFGHADDGTPLVRTDGWWGEIEATRLVRWRPDGKFAPRRQGGGSIPANWDEGYFNLDDLAIAHYGYARPRDRQAKYARYAGTTGHNPSHVASILQHPTLVPYDTVRTDGVA
jgi:hypothetical protein